MVQTANTHILKCQMLQKWSSQASAGYRTPTPRGPSVFGFSSWTIIFPLWAHATLSMANCRYVRITIASSKKRFWFNLNDVDQDTKSIHPKRDCSVCSLRSGKLTIKKPFFDFKPIFFWGLVTLNKAALVWKKKKLEGAIQINKRNNMAARAARGVFSEVFRDLILIRNNSYTVHV